MKDKYKVVAVLQCRDGVVLNNSMVLRSQKAIVVVASGKVATQTLRVATSCSAKTRALMPDRCGADPGHSKRPINAFSSAAS